MDLSRVRSLAWVLGAALVLAGCNTVRGIGQDMDAFDHWITRTVDKTSAAMKK